MRSPKTDGQEEGLLAVGRHLEQLNRTLGIMAIEEFLVLDRIVQDLVGARLRLHVLVAALFENPVRQAQRLSARCLSRWP